MRIHILSDLHLEFLRGTPTSNGHQAFKIPDLNRDLLILAGDIELGSRALPIIEAAAHQSPVIYILGNHEFYRQDYNETIAFWNRWSPDSQAHKRTSDNQAPHSQTSSSNLIFLHNVAWIWRGVRFLGATLWTDVNYGNPIDCENLRGGISDFHVIQYDARRFTPKDSWILHRQSRKFLEDRLKQPFPGPTVVITHHLPTFRSISPRFESSPYNPGFASHCDDLIERYQPDLWVHGHTHDSQDYWMGKTHIICNPKGYPHEPNPAFDPAFIVNL